MDLERTDEGHVEKMAQRATEVLNGNREWRAWERKEEFKRRCKKANPMYMDKVPNNKKVVGFSKAKVAGSFGGVSGSSGSAAATSHGASSSSSSGLGGRGRPKAPELRARPAQERTGG